MDSKQKPATNKYCFLVPSLIKYLHKNFQRSTAAVFSASRGSCHEVITVKVKETEQQN